MQEPEINRQHPFKIRFLFACLLVSATLLLIGASRLGDSLTTRQAEQDAARTEWLRAAEELLSGNRREIPERELRRLARRQPELFLQVLHQDLQPLAEP